MACEAMCSPSASSAIEPNKIPATISAAIITAVITTTMMVRVSPDLTCFWEKISGYRQGGSTFYSMFLTFQFRCNVFAILPVRLALAGSQFCLEK